MRKAELVLKKSILHPETRACSFSDDGSDDPAV